MESEFYSWAVGPYRSDWTFTDPDEAYEDAVRWKAMNWKQGEIHVWRKLIEEIFI